MSKDKDRGWKYLNAKGEDTFDFDPDNDGSWGYENEDGSGSYYGADGSWGYKNEDGSGSYYGADGSWGYKNEDGSGSYYGADGSWAYINEDGSGSYYGADGSWGYKNEDGSGSYYGDDEEIEKIYNENYTTTDENPIGSLVITAGVALGKAAAGLLINKLKNKRNHKTQSNGDDRNIKPNYAAGLYRGDEEKETDEKEDGSHFERGETTSEETERLASHAFPNEKYQSGFGEKTQNTVKPESQSKTTHTTTTRKKLSPTEYKARKENQPSETHSQRAYSSIPQKTEEKKGLIVILLIMLLILLAVGAKSLGLFSKKDEVKNHQGEIKLAYSSSYYQDKNYYDSVLLLQQQGLSDIRLTSLNDIKTGFLSKKGKIAAIDINGVSDFQAGTWISEDSIVSITYHSLEKKEKQGFDKEKNNHWVFNNIDISLPSYFSESDQSTDKIVYNVKGDKETQLTVMTNNQLSWDFSNQYDSFFMQKQEESIYSIGSGERIIGLGQKNKTVYVIQAISVKLRDRETFFHIAIASPDSSSIDYLIDFASIISGIYLPKETEIRIDFSSDDFKGENYENVIARLSDKGFTNIKAENLQDITLGIFAKEGAVKSVSIDGVTDYGFGEWVDREADVVISYHGKK